MSFRIALFAVLTGVALSTAHTNPQDNATHPRHFNESVTPYRDTREGMVKPLQSIEANLVPSMKRQGAAYIGAEYNAQSLHYRLKFMNDGAVIWIDVDGRNGAVIAQSGH